MMDKNTYIQIATAVLFILGSGGNYMYTNNTSAEEKAARHLEWRIRACEIDELVAETHRPDLVQYCTLKALVAIKEKHGG